jgi:PAS domain S-box-containing protein
MKACQSSPEDARSGLRNGLLQSLFQSDDATFLYVLGADGLPESLIDVNPAARNLLGLGHQEMPAAPQSVLALVNDSARASKLLQELPSRRHIRFEAELATAAGFCIPVEVTAFSLVYQDKQASLLIFRRTNLRRNVKHSRHNPLTFPVDAKTAELKLAHEQLQRELVEKLVINAALHESEEQLRILINAMPDIVCFKDSEGRWREANLFTLELFHLSDKSYQSKTDQELADLTPAFRQSLKNCAATDQAVWAAGTPLSFEECITGPGHPIKIFEIIKIPIYYPGGARKGLLVVGRDITARKSAEALMRISEERYRALAEQATDGIFIMDHAGHCLDVNPSGCSMLGYSLKEMLNLTFYDICTVHDIRRVKADIKGIQAGETFLGEYTLLSRNGQPLPVEINARMLPDGRILGVVRDITERRRAADTQKHLAAEAARLDRLNLVGEMAVNIGHELRNPMTTVRGYLQLLLGKPELVQYHPWFDLMVTDLDNANAIITNFISLAKNKAIRLSPCNLNRIINDILTEITMQNIHPVPIEAQLNDIPLLLLDEKEIRQMVINLIDNGLDANPHGETLHIRTFLEEDDVILAITDKGYGIPDHLLEKLGMPFLTTKEQRSGLGLAVCYHVANRHNGVIDIQTGPRGTTVYVRFRQPKSMV